MTDAHHWLIPLITDGVIVMQTRIAGDWGVHMPQRDAAFFHFLMEGRAYVRAEGMEAIELLPGDIALMMDGAAHQLSHTLHSKTVPIQQVLSLTNGVFSAEPEATSVVCGLFGVDRHMVMPAIKSLPSILHLKAGDHASIAQTLKQLRDEMEHREYGSQVMVRHLLSTLFIYIMREWAETRPADQGTWFSALQNPNISHALECIHSDPSADWTLEALAARASLSRSVFAKQFTETVGEPPHRYITRWRMGIASQLLEQTDMTLSDIAAKVGYMSGYSFSRAFKTARGLSPMHIRTRQKMGHGSNEAQ